MHLSTLYSLCLTSFAIAQDIPGYESAVESYLESILNNPSVASALSALATANPAALASFESNAVTAALTAPPDFAAFGPAGSLLASIYTAEISIGSKYGIISNGQIVPGLTDGGGFASETGGSFTDSDSFSSETDPGGVAATSSGGLGSGSTITSSAGAAITSSAKSSVVVLYTNAASNANSPSSSSSKAGAPQSTGVAVMGLIAGAVGGIAMLL